MKVTLDSLRTFSFLADSNRETFNTFVQRIGGDRPTYYLEQYIKEKGGTKRTLELFHSSNHIEQIHGNYRKQALLNCTGQAILDAAFLASMVDEIVEVNKIDSIESYMDFSDVCLIKLDKEIRELPLSLFESVPPIYQIVSSLDNSIKEFIIKQKTIKYIL